MMVQQILKKNIKHKLLLSPKREYATEPIQVVGGLQYKLHTWLFAGWFGFVGLLSVIGPIIWTAIIVVVFIPLFISSLIFTWGSRDRSCEDKIIKNPWDFHWSCYQYTSFDPTYHVNIFTLIAFHRLVLYVIILLVCVIYIFKSNLLLALHYQRKRKCFC